MQGPPGPPGLIDSPHITRVNWTNGVRMDVAILVRQLVSGLQFTVSSPLHRNLLDPQQQARQPQVVQVYFEPDTPVVVTAAISTPQPILVVHGNVRLQADLITWTCTDTPSVITGLFQRTGGRLQIRLHAGHLFDTQMRPFSSAVDALTSVASPHVPGGTWEGWIFCGTS